MIASPDREEVAEMGEFAETNQPRADDSSRPMMIPEECCLRRNRTVFPEQTSSAAAAAGDGAQNEIHEWVSVGQGDDGCPAREVEEGE